MSGSGTSKQKRSLPISKRKSLRNRKSCNGSSTSPDSLNFEEKYKKLIGERKQQPRRQLFTIPNKYNLSEKRRSIVEKPVLKNAGKIVHSTPMPMKSQRILNAFIDDEVDDQDFLVIRSSPEKAMRNDPTTSAITISSTASPDNQSLIESAKKELPSKIANSKDVSMGTSKRSKSIRDKLNQQSANKSKNSFIRDPVRSARSYAEGHTLDGVIKKFKSVRHSDRLEKIVTNVARRTSNAENSAKELPSKSINKITRNSHRADEPSMPDDDALEMSAIIHETEILPHQHIVKKPFMCMPSQKTIQPWRLSGSASPINTPFGFYTPPIEIEKPSVPKASIASKRSCYNRKMSRKILPEKVKETSRNNDDIGDFNENRRDSTKNRSAGSRATQIFDSLEGKGENNSKPGNSSTTHDSNFNVLDFFKKLKNRKTQALNLDEQHAGESESEDESGWEHLDQILTKNRKIDIHGPKDNSLHKRFDKRRKSLRLENIVRSLEIRNSVDEMSPPSKDDSQKLKVRLMRYEDELKRGKSDRKKRKTEALNLDEQHGGESESKDESGSEHLDEMLSKNRKIDVHAPKDNSFQKRFEPSNYANKKRKSPLLENKVQSLEIRNSTNEMSPPAEDDSLPLEVRLMRYNDESNRGKTKRSRNTDRPPANITSNDKGTSSHENSRSKSVKRKGKSQNTPTDEEKSAKRSRSKVKTGKKDLSENKGLRKKSNESSKLYSSSHMDIFNSPPAPVNILSQLIIPPPNVTKTTGRKAKRKDCNSGIGQSLAESSGDNGLRRSTRVRRPPPSARSVFYVTSLNEVRYFNTSSDKFKVPPPRTENSKNVSRNRKPKIPTIPEDEIVNDNDLDSMLTTSAASSGIRTRTKSFVKPAKGKQSPSKVDYTQSDISSNPEFLPLTNGTIIRWSCDSPEFRACNGKNFNIMLANTSYIDQEDNGTGLLNLPPGGVKPTQSAPDHTLYFHIHKGTAFVEVGDGIGRFKRKLKECCNFIVPKGYRYSIKNTSNTRELRLYFVKIKSS